MKSLFTLPKDLRPEKALPGQPLTYLNAGACLHFWKCLVSAPPALATRSYNYCLQLLTHPSGYEDNGLAFISVTLSRSGNQPRKTQREREESPQNTRNIVKDAGKDSMQTEETNGGKQKEKIDHRHQRRAVTSKKV